jgi:3-methyl-2-oxobutanoate hydroxymethyltransferase
MSVQDQTRRRTTRDLRLWTGDPIVSLTAYTTPMARWLDPLCDFLLVGDSLGMVLHGLDSTLSVTVEMMILHGAAVMRGSRHACVIVDLPFGSYQASPEQAFHTAARVMAETGCGGVKLEGGQEMERTIAFLVERGIPVLGHVGLKPQSVHGHGGFRAQGRTPEEAALVLADAQAVQRAGAFATVLEGTVEPVARHVAEVLDIPVIGIGASPGCDGQILVTEDMLGMFPGYTPKFVKQYAQLGAEVTKAVEAYAADVRARRFPGPEHWYKAPSVKGG